MPPRKVEFHTGHYYHLYNRGNNFQSVFFERENYLHFLRLLRQHLMGEALDVIAYCLMPNHYHLLVNLKTDALSKKMQPFLLAYTKAINKRYERVGSLFQGRFQGIHVDSNAYLLHLVQYIHLNPVKAGFVKAPEAWEFSSYREYVGLRDGTLPKMDAVRSQFTSAEAYCRFVKAHDENHSMIKHLTIDE